MATSFTNIIDDTIAANVIAVLQGEDKFGQIDIKQDDEVEPSGAVFFNLVAQLDEHIQYVTLGEDRLYTFSLRIYLKTERKTQRRGSLNRLTDWGERVKKVLKNNRNYSKSGDTIWSNLTIIGVDYNPALDEIEEAIEGYKIVELIFNCWYQERDS